MPFKGWPAEAIEFFQGLESDNSKPYWQAHKDVYETAVRAPMEALLTELAPEFGEAKIFRPYRDVRFSPDKSPYKTNIAAGMEGGGYLSLSADGLGVGCGFYMMAPDQLDRFRKAVVDDTSGEELTGLVQEAESGGLEVSAHEQLKTAPKGYPKDHPRIELLRHKGLITWRHWSPGPWLRKPAAKERVVDTLTAARPIYRWLERHVGASTSA